MATKARAFIGAGNVMLNPYDPVTGLQTGWVFGGSADKFALKPNSEIKSKKSKGRDDYGQTLATIALPGEADIAITFGEVNQDNIALAFMGKQSALNVAGGAITAEGIVAKLDKFVPLTKGNLSEAVTVTNADASTTFVKGTDYEVNYAFGWIKALATGNIDADQPLKVTATSNAITGTKIQGSVNAQLRTQVKFDGKNFVDGAPVDAEVYEAVLTPSDEFDFLADDWGQLTLTGKMTTPQGRTEPYVVNFRNATA
jgi:hypothetical protein